MLPSCGHFKNIPCPFYKLALCVRPHCPYKHQSADNGHPRQIFPSLVEETESLFDSKLNLNLTQNTSYSQAVVINQENVTYIPTPVDSNTMPPGILKTSNSNSEKTSTSFVPEYKPTPISKLKDCNTAPTILSVKSVKSEYCPEFPTVVRKKKNVEEYDPTEVKCIPKKTVSFVDPSSSTDSDIPVILLTSSEDELDDSESAPKFSDDDLEEVQQIPVSDTKKKVPVVEEKVSEESEVEEISHDKYSVVDEILVNCKKNEIFFKKASQTVNLSSKVNGTTSKVTVKQEKNTSVIPEIVEVKSKNINSNIVIKTEKCTESVTASKAESELSKPDLKSKKDAESVSSKAKKSVSHKKESKTEKSEKPREKSHKHVNSHPIHKDKAKKENKDQSEKFKHSKKTSEIKKPLSNDNKVSKTGSTSSEHSIDKSPKSSNHVSSDKKTTKKRKIEEQKGQLHSSNDEKSIKRSKCFADALNSSEPSASVLKEKIQKHSSGVKRKSEISDSDSEHRHIKHKSVSSSKKTDKSINSLPNSKKSKPEDASSDSKSKSNDDDNSDDDSFSNCDTLLSSSESDPDEECRRIFEECYPESSDPPKVKKKEETNQEKTKKATDLVILRKKRFAHPAASDLKKPPSIKNKIDIKRPIPMNPAQVMFNRFAQCQSKVTKQNENKDSASDAPKNMDKKRLNFVPNHNLLAAVKNKMNQGGNPALSNFSPLPPTVSKTLKVTNRVAHIPEAATKPRPIIPADFGCKVPSNVRQKYLNAFIDECLKFCPSEDEAYDHAIEEEKKAYDRSSSRSLYMNVAANTLKRLRNQAKEGPLASPLKNAPSRPEKKTVSHETVLNGPLAQRTSFSIGPKKQAFDIKDLGNSGMYEHLLQYVLTLEQLKENGFPRPHPVEKDKAIIEGVYANRVVYCNDAFKRTCCRCQKIYYVDADGDYVRDEECDFHWGRLWKKRIAGSLESRYSCCQGDSESDGCCVSPGHVFEGSEHHALKGFVSTLPKTPPKDNCYGIYSLDCEMCYTTAGMELTRVTVIDSNLKTIYESFVKPSHKVLDYNTRFSGITEENLQDIRTSIHDVQAVLLLIFNDKTILIGHSLESDFKALKLFHNTVVDTSVVFPHKNGLPFKRALRTLMAEKLNKIIQNDVGGHDSHEDAAACMELMLWKIKEDLKGCR